MSEQAAVKTEQALKRKKKKKAMPLTEHLRELRRRIIYVALMYLVFVIVCFVFVEDFVALMLAMTDGFDFVYLSPSELIMCYMRLSLIFALAALAPFIAYHICAFAAPALSKREKRIALLCLLAGFVFFVLGIMFSLKIVLPFTLDFLANFSAIEIIRSSISVDSYTRFVMNLLLVFGLVFEIPVLSLLLSLLGLLKPALLVKVRKYAILVIFILAAIITPPDIVSQIMVAAPMLLLYQCSIFICRFVVWFKAKHADDDDDDDDGDDDADDDDVDDEDDAEDNKG